MTIDLMVNAIADRIPDLTPIAEPERCQRRIVVQYDRRHHLIADVLIRNRVHGHVVDLGQALQYPLDRPGGEVLPVDTHPAFRGGVTFSRRNCRTFATR